MEENLKFIVEADDGQEIECETIFTFENPENGKNYLVYTDNETDEEGNLNIYACYFTPGVEDQLLEQIEDEAEWEMVNDMLDTFLEEDMN